MVFVIIIDPIGEWHHSTFPEPLITVDHDADDNVIKIVAVGRAARELAKATSETLITLGVDSSIATALSAELA